MWDISQWQLYFWRFIYLCVSFQTTRMIYDRSNGSAPDAGFDRVAGIYDTLAWLVFGNRLQEAQTIFLSCIPVAARILIIGGGSGWLLRKVLCLCQPRQIIYVEASVRMLAKARKTVQDDGRVVFRLGNETSVRSEETVDVVITPFFLDLFTEERLETHIIPQLLRALKPGGLWLVCDFVRTSVWWQQGLLKSMYLFFRLIANIEARYWPQWPLLLKKKGLRLGKQQPMVGGQVTTGWWING